MSPDQDELSQKIRQAQAREEAANPAPKKTSSSRDSGTGQAMKAAMDLVAAVGVGCFLGYWIDQWLGSKPVGIIIFFLLGFAAGLLNIHRAQSGQDLKVGFRDRKAEADKKEG